MSASPFTEHTLVVSGISTLTGPLARCFGKHEANMNWTLFHFASKIDCSSHEQIRIGSSNLNLAIKPSKVDLGAGYRLLTEIEPASKFCQFYNRVRQVFPLGVARGQHQRCCRKIFMCLCSGSSYLM